MKQISLAIVCMTLLLFSTSIWPQLKPVEALQLSDQPSAKLLASSSPSPFFLPTPSSSNSQSNVTNSTTGPATNSTTGTATNSTTGTATGVKFQPYENSTYGIRIQYPSNWIKQENHNLTSAGRIVKFSSPQGTSPATLNIIGGNRVPSNMSLEQFSAASINNLRQSFSRFNLLESSPTSLGGFPAHRLVYTAEVAPGFGVRSMQVWTVKDARDLIITYVSLPSDFSNYLPTIQHMIDTFAFIPTTAAAQPATAAAIPSNATTPTHFLLFQNLTAGFKIKYPSSWLKSENASANSSVFFQEPVLGARFVVLSYKFPQGYLVNQSKNVLFSVTLNAFSQPIQAYNPIRSIPATIAGNPANKTEFTFSSNGHEARGIVLISIIGDKLYLLSYAGANYSYPVLLPIAQEMIDSFAPLSGTTSATAAAPSINATSTASPMAGPAQRSSNNTYTNATDGISVTIPQGWTTEAGQNQANATLLTVVTLSPPISLDPNALMQVIVEKDTKPSANSSIDQYLRDELTSYRSNPSNNFKLISANTSLSVSGQPAYQLVFSFTPQSTGIGPSKQLEVGILLKGQAYLVDYYGNIGLFPKFLPEAQQIIRSLVVHPLS